MTEIYDYSLYLKDITIFFQNGTTIYHELDRLEVKEIKVYNNIISITQGIERLVFYGMPFMGTDLKERTNACNQQA
jgi:hypothetical protein